MRSTAFALASLLVVSSFLALVPGPARAMNALHHNPALGVPDNEVVVAIIDTGADGTHPEFGGYRGEAGVTDPQIVAWYDIGLHGPPAAGVVWDAATPVPYDSCPGFCHGTGTASLVGGATVGAYPGVKLAIAKITDASGGLVDIAAAIHWATVDVGADVI
ncbi:MAG: S8 family serine peptidase, partial [Thermoplasmatota archaeon]